MAWLEGVLGGVVGAVVRLSPSLRSALSTVERILEGKAPTTLLDRLRREWSFKELRRTFERMDIFALPKRTAITETTEPLDKKYAYYVESAVYDAEGNLIGVHRHRVLSDRLLTPNEAVEAWAETIGTKYAENYGQSAQPIGVRGILHRAGESY